jgi:Fungal chitosanase of glycosyl hydrolase group 75
MRTDLPGQSGIQVWAAAVLAVLLTACPGPQPLGPEPSVSPSPSVPPTPTPTPTPTPLPETFIPYSRMETAKLFNGMEIHAKVTTTEGAPAVVERKTPDAYTLELDVQVRVPQAAQTLEQLAAADPLIGALLPGLKDELPTSKVSNFYHSLYQLKVDAVNRTLARLDQIVSRHNFFDCNTILELQDYKTNRKALLIQSDMDVNADGSDADRTSDVEASSANFQPFTSYRWPKKTNKPSQFIPEREEKLKQLQSEYEVKTTTAERKKVLKDQLEQIQKEVSDLKKYSFLVAKVDPYVVLPGFMFRPPSHPFQPRLGDCVVVVYQGKLYPALLGDVGPSYKIGEASLRICSQLDPRSTAYNRPASDLNITYIVFPSSAEDPPGPPDLQQLHDRCSTLLNEIGGYSGDLWAWEDILSKRTPSPSPAASPSASSFASSSPSPSVSSSPQESVTPMATPSVTP